ncbi:Mss4-like protein [Aspergillus desertorum]
MSSTKTLTAACHCGSVNFTLTIPTSALPLGAHICNCAICRTTHGALASFHAPVPPDIKPSFTAQSSLEKLTAYRHAHATSTRYFCSTCGCHIGDQMEGDGIWNISISIFDENANEGAWVIDEHYFTRSTADGGLSALLPRIEGRELNRWDTQPGGLSDPNSFSPTPHVQSTEGDLLLARCHCGGVSFTISRPRDEFIHSPASKKWIHSSDPSKWLALVDVCRDCRLVTGAHTLAWLFVAKDHVAPPLPENLLTGTSKCYESSNGVYRTFCGTCGATVFYSEASRPDILDVSTGILHASDGVMLGSWAWWRTVRLGYPDDGRSYDRAFTDSLAEGLQEWGMKMHGEVQDFIVGSEMT